MLSIYVLAVSIILCLLIGSLVVSRGFHETTVIVYGILTISMLAMAFSNFMSLYVSDSQFFYVRSVMFWSTLSAYLSYLLIYNLKNNKHKPFYKNPFLYVTLAVALMDWTNLLFSGVKAGSPPRPIYESGVFVFFIHFIVAIVISIWYLANYIKSAKNKNEKLRYKLLIFGLIPAMIFAPLTGFVLPSIGVNNMIIFTPIYVVIFVIFVGYAIVRHGLFDIRQAVIRTMTYALSLLTLSVIYYCTAYVLSTFIIKDSVTTSFSANPINIVLALVLAFVFQPIKKFFDKLTNNIFYKDHYRSDDFFARLNKTLANTTELRDLLERAANEIGRTLKSEQAFFFIYTDSGHYISAGTSKHRQLPVDDALQLRNANEANANSVIIASMLPTNNPERRLMLSHRIELILPLINHHKCIGFLCLGEHLNSGYTNRDVKVLNTISNELVIAIQNALAVQEIREFNTTLQQQVANATQELREKNTMLRQLDKAKDEFVGMASHQLRTPLTSIKGYISMVLEGDAGKISDSQSQLLNEAFNSSERMVRLINDFLNVSRLQTGKFIIDKRPIDLSKVVSQEIDSLNSSAVAHDMKFVYDVPKDFPLINIDESKIRQVIMNFADNAIYYSHENTPININLSVDDGEAIFTVQDTGIGVPENEKSKLFSKFFRATNARKQRPDGTGVGLYLAKKIILAHGGKVIFKSIKDKGSTFGFSLPLK